MTKKTPPAIKYISTKRKALLKSAHATAMMAKNDLFEACDWDRQYLANDSRMAEALQKLGEAMAFIELMAQTIGA